MKIITKKQEIQHKNMYKILQDENEELKQKYNDLSRFYDELSNRIYYELFDLKNSLKCNISKDKIKIKIQELLIILGGKR